MDLKGKVAVVTGASRGIGKAVAIKLASLGADIAMNYAGNEQAALETKSEVEALGVKVICEKVDVSDFDQVKEFMDFVTKEFGSIDILVNNAGITKDTLLMKMKEDDWDRVIDVNLKGVFNCTKSVTRQMMKQRSGRIINMTSIVGITGNAGQSNYCAAKAGVIGLTKATARELASRNINVNAIAPGFIATDMTDVLKDDIKDSMLASIPLGKFGKPEDIANAVAFLASDMSAYITGQVINVDGGFVMQ
ncbi:3-oxoacyl-[acyl-carrier-protein] reductase [Peptoclostridium litorale DSM 5388]|uniref:3-oxoacyl-[acyl-carrier-protein] reductase n=1 Tax=Peptoclostridium litorale DSM 5388 TaxID=1121324 RepID=A0A069RBI8_PEPLI|nr:3-oxoacyl-[acyl-carrier-protein] reductase [Peptoclostridium litorale]KDR94103.1 3-oxoacyl-[acyl-carrier-protein] reductase FabG [Peptoclostridium litorale DSM 5388]SIN80901.1 3-oxoacyl-[acyl-carrier-protein] reductase [Peptoclostridium litorale DSM 5388]